jgi:transcriptional regulator with XRE-family HTH domain
MWIKQRRKQIGVTQEELSARLQIRGFDISRATVSHWEQEQYQPPMQRPDFVKALAEALETEVLDVLVMAGYEIPSSVRRPAARAADLVERMPPERQKTALTLLESLLKEKT